MLCDIFHVIYELVDAQVPENINPEENYDHQHDFFDGRKY